MASLSDNDLVTALRKRIDQAISASTANDEQRRHLMRQFFLDPTGTEEEDYSTAQSADVSSVVTATLAQNSVAYSTDMVVEFEADSAEDEVRAKAESRAVNKILIEDNNGFPEIMDACQNDMLSGCGIAKVYWQEDINSFFVRHEKVVREDLPFLTEREQGVDRRLVSFDPEKGVARVEVTETKRRLRVEAVSPDRFFIDPDWDKRTLDGCTLCGEIFYKTRDELSRMGCDWALVKALPAAGIGDDLTWKRRGQVRGAVDPLQMQSDLCRVYLVYARYTQDDDDDRTYLHKCWIGETGDDFLMEPEMASRIPYAMGCSFPVANQRVGVALAWKASGVQDVNTELLRQLISNVRNGSWSRLGVVQGQADAADVTRPKPGGVIRLRTPDAIVPIPVLDMGPTVIGAMDQMRTQRSERCGAGLDLGSAPLQVASDSAHATERFYSASEAIQSYAARNFSELVRQVFLLGHQELRTGEGGPIALKMGEDWETQDPQQWRERRWCNVTVAPSFGERVHMSQALSACLQWDMGLLQAGMQDTLISLPGMYKKLCDWLRLNLVPNPEAYYIDPSSQQAQQAAQAKAQAQQQQSQQQMQLLMAVEQLKAQVDKYKTDTQAQVDSFKTVYDGEVKLAESDTKGSVDVIRARADAAIARRLGAAGSGGSETAAKNGSSNGSGGSGS